MYVYCCTYIRHLTNLFRISGSPIHIVYSTSGMLFNFYTYTFTHTAATTFIADELLLYKYMNIHSLTDNTIVLSVYFAVIYLLLYIVLYVHALYIDMYYSLTPYCCTLYISW
jgi:hypothetical protein